MLTLNDNKIFPFNSYLLLGNISEVIGFKLFEGTDNQPVLKIFRGEVVAAPFDLQKTLTEGQFVYFRSDFDIKNELEQMYPFLECNNKDVAGAPFVMVPKDKLLFILLESKHGIIIPKMSVSGPKKLQ
jgi:hypothetical protein